MKELEALKRALQEGLDGHRAGTELRRRTLKRALSEVRAKEKRGARFLLLFAVPALAAFAILLFLSILEVRQARPDVIASESPSSSSVPPSMSSPPPSSDSPPSPPRLAGSKVVIPPYMPAGYKVSEVVTETGDSRAEDAVVIRYSALDDGELEWRRSAKPSRERVEGFEPVMVGDRSAWIRIAGNGDVVLIWEDDKYKYSIVGRITEGDAKLMAQSIYIGLQDGREEEKR